MLVSRELLGEMETGSAIVDISVDQGGCVETTRATTHSAPRYVEEGIVHYAVANMPGAVPQTSTYALTNATLGYALELADKGWRAAVAESSALARGVNHFDVAPSYGDAELRLAPSVERHRERMFLACKTRERRASGARAELARSLERLRTDRLDLYQCHALSSHVELEQVLGQLEGWAAPVSV